jgi:hypothetical protein
MVYRPGSRRSNESKLCPRTLAVNGCIGDLSLTGMRVYEDLSVRPAATGMHWFVFTQTKRSQAALSPRGMAVGLGYSLYRDSVREQVPESPGYRPETLDLAPV